MWHRLQLIQIAHSIQGIQDLDIHQTFRYFPCLLNLGYLYLHVAWTIANSKYYLYPG